MIFCANVEVEIGNCVLEFLKELAAYLYETTVMEIFVTFLRRYVVVRVCWKMII